MSQTFPSPFAQNPFLAPLFAPPLPPAPASEPAGDREVAYALVQSGPPVDAEEVETHLDAVEVKITWGRQILSVAHLDASKGFTIGEGGDFVVPDLGCVSLVSRRLGASYAIVPPGATAIVRAPGEAPRTAAEGEEIALASGVDVTIDVGRVTIAIASVRAGRRHPVSLLTALASSAALAIALSFVGHAAIVASLATFMPRMNDDDAEGITREQLLSMQAFLDASAEREEERQKEQQDSAGEETGGGSKGGEPHMGPSGAAGTTKPVTTQGHMAFKGTDDRAQVGRREELELAATGGLVGMLLAGAPSGGPSSPWATDAQLGQDAEDKLGALFGPDANDAMGTGLGLSGTGEGGGGKGLGVGIDGVGSTVGGGGGGPGRWGYGRGDKDGLGNGHGPGRGGHTPKPIVMRTANVVTNGHLPAEVIQRIVRQNFGRFRLCYEGALRGNPGLSGRVTTKFVIGRDGAVAQALDAGSDLPSQEAVSCVVRSFTSLSFPQPEGGVATVTYPIVFSPGE